MEAYFKKYFWTLNIVVVVLCAVFSARACNNVVAAKYLSGSAPAKADTARSRAAAAKRARARAKQAAEPVTKSGQDLVARNMFCSACQPVVPVTPSPTDPLDPNQVPRTSLPLALLATNVGIRESYSFATIRNTQNDKQGAYWMGDTIPGAGEVVAINARYVDFKNAQSRRVERIALLENSAPVRTEPKEPERPVRRRASPGNQIEAELEAGIKKVGENSYEISRDLVDKVRGNIARYARGARIVPHIENGKANGYKLYAIRPSSVFAKIGIRNGDIIHAVNGLNIASPRQALEVYTKLTDASNLSLSVTRRGKPVTLKYRIR